jgi:hypothetical protein
MTDNKPKPEYLRVYMKCQLCLHEWQVEEYGLLFDIMMAIEGCPSTDRECSKVSSFTNRPSLEALKFEKVDNPFAVSGEFLH